jgi:hypothetical protein
MKRHRTTLCTAAVLLGACALAPPAALAGGPLLSGYGGPGAGAQSIIGATLLNGPSGGSGGSSSGGGSAGNSGGGSAGGSKVGSSGASSALDGGSKASGTAASGGSTRGAHPSSSVRGGGAQGASGLASGVHGRAFSALPPGRASAAASIELGTSWISGADVLALALAAGALALIGTATVRLARTRND